MKKFNYFLLTFLTIILTSYESNAFTTNLTHGTNLEQVNDLNPVLVQDQLSPLKLQVLELSSSSSVSMIDNNLTILYSICAALMLFNLVAQIKIIHQMIHLFFQIQKKDDATVFN